MRRSVLALAACTATAALSAGCGSNFDAESPSGASPGSGGSPGLVAETDVSRVLQSISTIDQLCNGPTRPSSAELGRAANGLLSVYKLGPKRVVKYGSGAEAQTMQTIVVIQAGRLRHCGDPTDAERLTKVAGTAVTSK